jgi:methionyl-tRNA formyltransferase
MAGEREIGCTLHYITDGTIDTGPIVARVPVPVHAERSLFWHVLSLYPPGIEHVARAIDQLARGEKIGGTVQAGGTYFTYPRDDEWSEFLARGWRVVDPSDLEALYTNYLR